MKFEFDLILGNKTIKIIDEAKTNKDMLKKLAFFSQLPETGPTGNKDLEIQYRTPKGFEYINIVDKEAKKQFSFGTVKETGELFGKGWTDLYEGKLDKFEQVEEEPKQQQQPVRQSTSTRDVLSKYGL